MGKKPVENRRYITNKNKHTTGDKAKVLCTRKARWPLEGEAGTDCKTLKYGKHTCTGDTTQQPWSK